MRQETAHAFSVAQVNAYIKKLFVRDFILKRIAVKGEVSNCKYHQSGHIYFTLKDGTGTLAAVMFAENRGGLRFRLSEGQKVVVMGSVSVYERDGIYELYAKEIRLEGLGDLYQQLEERKNRLAEMGMFAPEYKKPIPRFASRIGVVTAPTGAAIRDIVNISHRRNPTVQLILYPAIVQGEEAAGSIIRGIETLDAMNLDCLIVGRGGGSIEDLWAFNEEEVARAIFDCATPVISAVGHETDTTIADFAADLRAPTPSAAAELAVFDRQAFLRDLDVRRGRLARVTENKITAERLALATRQRRLAERDPRTMLENRRRDVDNRERGLTTRMESRMADEKHRLALAAARLEALSPLARLQQGSAFVTDQSGTVVRSVKQAGVGQLLTVTLADGSLQTEVKTIHADAG